MEAYRFTPKVSRGDEHPLDAYFRARYYFESVAATRKGGMAPFGIKRGSPLFGVGLNPHREHDSSHQACSAELIPAISDLVEDTRFRTGGVIMVIDSMAIFTRLSRSRIPHPIALMQSETPMDWLRTLGARVDDVDPARFGAFNADFDALLKEGHENLEMEGARLRFLIQLMIGQKVRSDVELLFPDKKLPATLQLSHMLQYGSVPGAEHAKRDIERIFSTLFEIVEHEDSADADEFRDLLWKTIPYALRKRYFGGAAGRSYPKLKGKKPEARQFMGYVLSQIALILYWGGVKYGYEGEKPFDEVTQFARERFGARLGLDHISLAGQFHYLTSKNSVKVPYRYHDYPNDDVLERPPFETIGFYAPSAEGELSTRLSRMVDRYLPLIEANLKRLATPAQRTAPEGLKSDGPIFFRLQLYRHLREFVAELNSDSELSGVLEASGINAVTLGTSSVFDLAALNQLPIAVKDLNDSIPKKHDFDRAQLVLHALDSIPDRELTHEKISEALWLGVRQQQVFDRINYAKLLRNDPSILSSGSPETHEWVGQWGLTPDQKDIYVQEFLGSAASLLPILMKNYLMTHFSDRHVTLSREVDCIFEDKEAYLIRYLAQVLSGPVSEKPDLAGPVSKILQMFSRVLLPGRELQVDFYKPQWGLC